jgi:hypothetical protein
MALKKLEADLNFISKLGDNPGVDDGLTTEEIKEKFDKSGNIIKEYINECLLPDLEKTVDIDALQDYILQETEKGISVSRRMYVGNLLEKSFSCGDFALPSVNNFSAQLNNGSITVHGGACVMQGNIIELADDYSVTLAYEEGIAGTYRSDIICLRVSTDESGSCSAKIVLIGGKRSYTGYADPEHKKGDINTVSSIRDLPLYRLKMDGESVSALEALFLAGNSASVTLLASGWTGDSAPYTQTVTVAGLTDGRRVMVYPEYGDDYDANVSMQEACGCLSYAKREGQNVTITCLEDKPAVDIAVIVEAYV